MNLSQKIDSAATLKDMLQGSGVFDFCDIIAKEYGRNIPYKLVAEISALNDLEPCRAGQIKTIGIFYYHMDIGGVQRVISRQIEIFKKLGYNVVVFTTDPPSEKDYCIGDTSRVVIDRLDPNSSVRENAEKFVNTMRQYDIDLFYSHAFGDVFHLLCFLLLTKFCLKIPCFVHYHNVFSYSLCRAAIPQFFVVTEILKMADLVLSLSRVDCLYFQSEGVKSVYLPNPPTFDKIPDELEKVSDGKTVLFLARIEPSQKRPCDAVAIIEKVALQVPDVKLVIVGCGKEKDEAQLLKRIEKSSAKDNICFKGHSSNVVEYLLSSDIFLCTSTREGYPMTFAEALCCGLPIVTYDMPYLEVTRGDSGISVVPQLDIESAADKIIYLLENPVEREKASEKARLYGEKLFEFDHENVWSDIIMNYKSFSNESVCQINDVGIMLNTLKFHLFLGDKERLKKKNKQLADMQKSLTSLQKSFSFKIGRLITSGPRKMREWVRLVRKVK